MGEPIHDGYGQQGEKVIEYGQKINLSHKQLSNSPPVSGMDKEDAGG